MKILGLEAENFKRLRLVELDINRHLTVLTGRNGQGKTSAGDALYWALKGRKADLAAPLVRKGQERTRVRVKLADGGSTGFTVTRSMSEGGIPTLTIEPEEHKKRNMTPQEFLDEILGALTFDPLEFIRMDSKEQVAELRKTAKVDLDFDKMAEENLADYNQRKIVNREVDELEKQLKVMTVLEGLPAEKLDETAVQEKLHEAGEANRKAQEVFKAKQELGAAMGVKKNAANENARTAEQYAARITELEAELKRVKDAHKAALAVQKTLSKELADAIKAYDAAPAGEPVDVNVLVTELQSIQRTNRAIDQRNAYNALHNKYNERRMASQELSAAIDRRDEQKREALAAAKIPIAGLEFNEKEVLYKGIPLRNLGEGEQIRISTEIGMAANPKLRLLCIRHGEALDEEGMKMIATMAEEHDFQVLMMRVDSSGKVGIVIEDGSIVARNEG